MEYGKDGACNHFSNNALDVNHKKVSQPSLDHRFNSPLSCVASVTTNATLSQEQLFTTDSVVALVSNVDGDMPIQAVVMSSLPQVQNQLLTVEDGKAVLNGSVDPDGKGVETVHLQSADGIVLHSVNGQSSTILQNEAQQIQQVAIGDIVGSDSDISSSMALPYKDMVLATIQTETGPSVSMAVPDITSPIHARTRPSAKYFCLSSLAEVEEAIRKHTEETFSHFVVAKKTKAYGSTVNAIDVQSKFRIHWQSRDLTSTEECAVQIPFEGIPFIYIGEKAYMCHLGRNKAGKSKPVPPEVKADGEPKKHRSRLTKKQGCPAKIFVKQIAKFPQFQIPNNSEYLRTQMSQKLRKAILTSEGQIEHVVQYVGTLPDISEHVNHDIGENTPVREPIDPLIRDKIVELAWKFNDASVLPRHIKFLLENYVENELFKGRTPPSRNRRRFYPSEKDIANYLYKSRMVTKLSMNEQDQLVILIQQLQHSQPDHKFAFLIENENQVTQNIDVNSMDDNLHHSTTTETKISFGHQTSDQQRLLNRYGKQVILTELSRPGMNLPFPFFGLFVPTNVDFQLVYVFITPDRTSNTVQEALTTLVEWNSNWSPKFFVVDFCAIQINAVETLFPSCTVSISPESREAAWEAWLNDPVNLASLIGDKNEVLQKLQTIAYSYTEETLNKAAQSLENSEVWRLSEGLRNWFSTAWLAEAKRWVVGYRHEEYFSTLHFDGCLFEEIKPFHELHYSHLKNRKLSDFFKTVIEQMVPACYLRYVNQNILDYRKQYSALKSGIDYPSFLPNKPSCVVNHLQERIKLANMAKYTVSQIQPGIFWIQEKNENNVDVTYAMSFGDTSTLPSCVCIDWLKYRIPCEHLVAVFLNIQGWSWDMLSTVYRSNPVFSLDFSCFDQSQEDLYLSSMTDNVIDNVSNELVLEIAQTDVPSSLSTLTIVKPVMNSNLVPYIDSTPLQVNNAPVSANSNLGAIVTAATSSGSAGPFQFITNLATDCDSFCQELSNNIHHVDNQNILQKVKLDLQLMLNDVKLEISKVPPKSNKRSFPNSSPEDLMKKKKVDTQETALLLNNTFTTTNPTLLKSPSMVPGSDAHNFTGTSAGNIGFNETAVGQNVWIFDAELNIKLNKSDQKNILDNSPLSLEIMRSVQNVLRHQFDDVEGLYDPELLGNLSTKLPQVENKDNKKVVQLHMLEDNHWSVSAKIMENIYIFCCTLSSKAKVIEQILHMTPENRMGENILFVERMEKEECTSACGLFAIAYSVAFAFDIEPRSLVFDESQMRPHLSECLEDMCFSMFPLKAT